MMGYLHFIANIPVKGTRWLIAVNLMRFQRRRFR